MTEGIFIYELQGKRADRKTENKTAPDEDGSSFAVITGLAGARRHLQVPELLGGAPVRQIAAHALREQAGLRTLSLPRSLVSVGAFALHNCPDLTEISLHDGIRDFHNGVLRQDLQLRRIHIFVHEGNYTVMRDILSDSDARFQFCLHLPDGEARLLFPGYDYAFAENTMARTIQFTISGSGMVYRECVRRKGISFREYDRLFSRVIPDDAHAAAQIAADRLLFPYDLAQAHALAYEKYLRENARDALVQFVGEAQTDPESGYLHLHLMADRGMITGQAADAALRITSRLRLTDVTSIILAGRAMNAGRGTAAYTAGRYPDAETQDAETQDVAAPFVREEAEGKLPPETGRPESGADIPGSVTDMAGPGTGRPESMTGVPGSVTDMSGPGTGRPGSVTGVPGSVNAEKGPSMNGPVRQVPQAPEKGWQEPSADMLRLEDW